MFKRMRISRITLMGARVPYSLYVSMPTSMKVVCDEKIRSPHPCVDCRTQVMILVSLC